MGTGGTRVVRVYTVRDAPTGEGLRYVDERGGVWKQDLLRNRPTLYARNGQLHVTSADEPPGSTR